MDWPNSMIEIADEAVAKHPCDIDKSVDEVDRRCRKLPDYADWEMEIIRSQFRDLVHERRHADNNRTRRENGIYGRPAKVVVGESEAVGVAYSLYLYKIDGRTLGTLYGEELPELAARLRATGDGCYRDSYWLESAAKLVPAGKMVQDAVSEQKLGAMLKAAERRIGKTAA